MNSKYTKPVISVNHFIPNESFAACGPPYRFVCNAQPSGILFSDNDGNGRLNKGDEVVNRMHKVNIGFFKTGQDFNVYSSCSASPVHEASSYAKGFLVPTNVFNSAKIPKNQTNWLTSGEKNQRTNYDFDKMTGSAVNVWIWDQGQGQGGYHATVNEPTSLSRS